MKKSLNRNISNRLEKNEKKLKKRFKKLIFKIKYKIKEIKLLILKQRKNWIFIIIIRNWIIILLLIIKWNAIIQIKI